jgi:HK97 gp10 family phage protein
VEITCTIEGMGNLKAQFEELSNKAQRAVMRSALKQTGAVVVKAAKAKVPVLTGKLKASIKSSVSVKEGARSYVDIGWGKKAYWGLFVEKGTCHRGAHPFLRPALDENHAAILQTFTEALNTQIQKQTAKARAA